MTAPVPKPAPKRTKVPPTRGAAALAALGLASGWRTASAKLGVSEALLRAVSKSERRAGPTLRAKLVTFGIELAAWDPEPVRTSTWACGVPVVVPGAATAGGVAGAAVASPSEGDLDDAEIVTTDEAEENVRRLRRACRLADEKPATSVRDRAALGGALTAAIRQLERLRCDGELSEARLSAAPAFQSWLKRRLGKMRELAGTEAKFTVAVELFARTIQATDLEPAR